MKNATEKYTTPYYMFYVCVIPGMPCFHARAFQVAFSTTTEDGSTLETSDQKINFFRARHIVKTILKSSSSYSNICVTQSNLLFGAAHVNFYFQSILRVSSLTSDQTLFQE